MKLSSAIAGGVAGTAAAAALHEGLRRASAEAPRVDVLNKDLIKKGLKRIHRDVPDEKNLERLSVGGELLIDATYFGLAGLGGKKGVWVRGALLGLVAGLASALLPKPFDLKRKPTNRTPATQLMSVGLYVVGGLVAAAVAQAVENAQTNNEEEANEPVLENKHETFPAADLVF